MRSHDFETLIPIVQQKAWSMWQTVIAQCPDEHLQLHLAEARKVARDKGFKFNRIVWEGDFYGFFQGDEAVAVIERKPDQMIVHFNPKEEPQ